MDGAKGEQAEEHHGGPHILQSILEAGTGKVQANASTSAHTLYNARVRDKRVQLANLDRARPVPKPESLAAEQIRKRDDRLVNKARQQQQQQQRRRNRTSHTGTTSSKKAADSKKPFSRRERQRLGLDTIELDKISYERLIPIHELWRDYIWRLLGFVDEHGQVLSNQFQVLQSSDSVHPGREEVIMKPTAVAAFQTSLVKSDFTGALMKVTRALNPSLVGIEGLVAKETAGTFVIVVESQHPLAKKSQRHVKVIPKQNSIFSLQIPLPSDAIPPSTMIRQQPISLRVPLFGNQLCSNMQTRATKKFKPRKTIDL